VKQVDRWHVTEVLQYLEGEDWKDYFPLLQTIHIIDEKTIDKFYARFFFSKADIFWFAVLWRVGYAPTRGSITNW